MFVCCAPLPASVCKSTFFHLHIYIYMHTYMCVCACNHFPLLLNTPLNHENTLGRILPKSSLPLKPILNWGEQEQEQKREHQQEQRQEQSKSKRGSKSKSRSKGGSNSKSRRRRKGATASTGARERAGARAPPLKSGRTLSEFLLGGGDPLRLILGGKDYADAHTLGFGLWSLFAMGLCVHFQLLCLLLLVPL